MDMKDPSNEAGLTLEYVLEIMWMVYPPDATGFDWNKRHVWMKIVPDSQDVDIAFMGQY